MNRTRTFWNYVLIPALVGGVIGFGLLALPKIETLTRNGSYADAVAVASPSVVNIFTLKSTPTYLHPICRLPQYRDLCARSGRLGRRLENSLGSGVVMREDGYIVTNDHVIAGADDIIVLFADGQQASAAVVGTDTDTDLAVIKVEASGLRPIDRAIEANIRVGDIVLAIGNPFGIGSTVSLGIVSAMGRSGINDAPLIDFIQTDAAINPGNSGGPLIGADGRLVGINTLIYSNGAGSEGIGFAIPKEIAIAVFEDILEHGEVQRGWLGVTLEPTPGDGRSAGLLIRRVSPFSPASTAGIRAGDVLIAINGIAARSSVETFKQLAATNPGEQLALRIQRQGLEFDIGATAGQRPSPNGSNR